jgi:hypothetical protein
VGATNTVTDLLNTNASQTAFTIRNNPVGGSTPCHAMQVTQAASSGDGAGLNVVSNNSSAPAIRVKAAGPLIQLYDADNVLRFAISNAGAITTASSTTFTSVTTTGAVAVGTTLGVTGASTLTGNVTVGGTLAVTGATTLTGAVTLTGGISGNATLTGGDLTIQGTGKAYRFRRGGGGLDLEATGADLVVSNWSGTAFDGTQRSYLRLSADAQNMQVAGKVEFVDALYGATKHVLDGAANTIGFYGATAAAKQTVSGSRGGNAALASLITALATYGLITDGTSA